MLRVCLALLASLAQAGESPWAQFDALYADIRDQHISRDAARAKVRELLPQLKHDFYARGGKDTPKDAWRFPVEGYAANSIGGKDGSGYLPNGYDWFDGYKSKGHPGHDIFIHDRNQDELDDATGKPVNVVSVSSGIVVAFSPEWKPDSILRGGRYLYIYDPSQNGIFYYAHQRRLLVKPGDIVSAGQAIGTVGRSGRNAAAPRSPTHLHVMFLAVDGGDHPRPRDIYRDLARIGRR